MKCMNCSKDIVSKGTKPKKYCSDACRMQYKRTVQTNTGANEQQTNIDVPDGHKVEQIQLNKRNTVTSQNKTSDVASGSTNSDEGEQNCQSGYSKEDKLLAAIFPPEVEVDPNEDLSCLSGPANLKDYHSPHGRRYVPRQFPDDMNWGDPMTVSELAAAGLKYNRVTIPGDWDYKGVCEQVDGEWQVIEQTPDISKLSDEQLQRELRYMPGTSWVGSPEYKEVMRRRKQEPVQV